MVEFLLSLKVFPVDLSMILFRVGDVFFETGITKDCSKMSSSLYCDFDVATCEYSFCILLYNKEQL